jgi:hypothetical protein
VGLGRKTIAERASEHVEKFLRSNPPALPEKGLRDELARILAAHAKANGVASLPELP